VRLQVYVQASEIHQDPPEWDDQVASLSAAAAAAKPWPAVTRLYQLRRALRVTLKRAAGTGGYHEDAGDGEGGGGGGDDLGEGGAEGGGGGDGKGGGERGGGGGGGGAARGYATTTSASAVAHELYRSLASEDTVEPEYHARHVIGCQLTQ